MVSLDGQEDIDGQAGARSNYNICNDIMICRLVLPARDINHGSVSTNVFLS
jgi:hypothetical protein